MKYTELFESLRGSVLQKIEEANFVGNKKLEKEMNNASGDTLFYHGRDAKGVYKVTKVRKKGESEYKEVGKRVYEEVEQIDEVSARTLGSYVKKATADHANRAFHAGLTRTHADSDDDDSAFQRHTRKAVKRRRGIERAVDKMSTKFDRIKKLSEDEQQIDEISDKTLKSYVTKASASRDSLRKDRDAAASRGYDAAHKGDWDKSDVELRQAAAHSKQAQKRSMGVIIAKSRLQREDVEQIDEDYSAAYHEHMNKHYAAADAGKWSAAERHAKNAESAAAKHMKATGKKVKDPGYTGSSPHISEGTLTEAPHGPRSGGERRFVALHSIIKKGHPHSTEAQHSAVGVFKDKSKLASYEDGEDEEAYHAAQGTAAAERVARGTRGKVNEGVFDAVIRVANKIGKKVDRVADKVNRKTDSVLGSWGTAEAARKKRAAKPKVNEGLDEAKSWSHSMAGSHGVMHPEFLHNKAKIGDHVDFYDHGTGDKKYGMITKKDSQNVHIKVKGSATKKFKYGTNYPGLHEDTVTEGRKPYAIHTPPNIHHPEQLDEISKKKLGDYVMKASQKIGDHAASAAHAMSAGDIKNNEYHGKKRVKRQLGIWKAVDRLREAMAANNADITESEVAICEGVKLKNTDHGWVGTHALHGKKHEPETKKWAPHVQKHLETALARHKAVDDHYEKVTGSTTTSAKARAKMKVDHKMVGHYLDSGFGRHLADHAIDGGDPKHPDTVRMLQKSAKDFTRAYNPLAFD